MRIKRQFAIEAPVGRVWDVLANQFASVAEWASFVDQSSARTDGRMLNGAPCTGRVCETTMGPVREQITEFDENRRIVAYDALGEKMPFFVKGMSNRWILTSLGPSKTRVDMNMRASLTTPFNVFMGPLIKIQMGGMLTKATEELTYFVEKGRPHPRTASESAKKLHSAA